MGKSYVNVLTTYYQNIENFSSKTLPGDVSVTCERYTLNTSVYQGQNTSSKEGYYPELSALSYNLTGTGTIHIKMNSFSNNYNGSSTSRIFYDGDAPTATFSVSEGIVTDISYSFITERSYVFCPGSIVVEIV